MMNGTSRASVACVALFAWLATACGDDGGGAGSWGDCGPEQLMNVVPAEAEQAALDSSLPGGLVEVSGLGCVESETATLGPGYLDGDLDDSAADAASDDFIVFSNEYIFLLFCDDDPRAQIRVWFYEGKWSFCGVGGPEGADMLGELDQRLGSDLADCTRGLFDAYSVGVSFAVVTDNTFGTLIYPLNSLESEIWGSYKNGDAIGEFHFTKEAFLEWWESLE